jgi:hypothetical protein
MCQPDLHDKQWNILYTGNGSRRPLFLLVMFNSKGGQQPDTAKCMHGAYLPFEMLQDGLQVQFYARAFLPLKHRCGLHFFIPLRAQHLPHHCC